MFLDNEATKQYFEIIANARKNPFDGYTEQHHILPRCCGGNNEKENLVRLRARDHFIVHTLLIEMVSKEIEEYYNLVFALQIMTHGRNRVGYEITPDEFEQVRLLNAKLCSERAKKRVEEGTHNFLGEKNPSHQRIKDGTHPFLDPELRARVNELNSQRLQNEVKEGTHIFLNEEFIQKNIERTTKQQKLLVENGQHLFQNREWASERTQRCIKEGTHNFVGKNNPIFDLTPEERSEKNKKGSTKRWAKLSETERKEQTKNLTLSVHLRWAKHRKANGLPPKPGDEELLKNDGHH